MASGGAIAQTARDRAYLSTSLNVYGVYIRHWYLANRAGSCSQWGRDSIRRQAEAQILYGRRTGRAGANLDTQSSVPATDHGTATGRRRKHGTRGTVHPRPHATLGD